MPFNFTVNFWTMVDENGSITWTVTEDKISILYDFNDENIDLGNSFSLLNNFAFKYGLDVQSWKFLSQ